MKGCKTLNYKKIMFIGTILLGITFTSCKKIEDENNKNQDEILKTPITLTTVEKIKVQLDESYENFFKEDPFSMLSNLTKEVHPKIDKELYNYLFNKVLQRESKITISDFLLSREVIMDTAESLYEQVGFQLFYIYRIKVSEDLKTVDISYREYTEEEIKEYQDTFYQYMNHLLYNVAPANLSPTKRFFAVYEFITKHGSYSNDMEDETTFTASSILVNKKGICGGYSILAYYVLNFLGIPTDYISNESHAWNMVTLNGKKYHTDFTWGAAYNDSSYLSTALMSDMVRMVGLEANGFGEYPIIKGLYRENPSTPDVSSDTTYDFLEEVRENYSLDFINDWIYYSNSNGLYRVRFDGSNRETILDQFVYLFKEYQGVIYYRNESDGFLYQVTPKEEAILVDDEMQIDYIKLYYGKLYYGRDDKTEKVIDLNSFNPISVNKETIHYFDEVVVNNNQTFEINIEFSVAMKEEEALTKIGLVDSEGNILPTYMFFDNSKSKVTIRSRVLPHKKDELTLYILGGMRDVNNNALDKDYALKIMIEYEN